MDPAGTDDRPRQPGVVLVPASTRAKQSQATIFMAGLPASPVTSAEPPAPTARARTPKAKRAGRPAPTRIEMATTWPIALPNSCNMSCSPSGLRAHGFGVGDGVFVGSAVGVAEGSGVGEAVLVGSAVGVAEGCGVGVAVLSGVSVGAGVGVAVFCGVSVGAGVGEEAGCPAAACAPRRWRTPYFAQSDRLQCTVPAGPAAAGLSA